MSRKPRALVFDSWAIIAYLEDEPAGEKAATMIADAHDQGMTLMTSTVNAGEVWYIIARKSSEAEADRTIVELGGLGLEFKEADWELAREAAAFKATKKMSYADCFAAALARRESAQLVTGDPEFKQVEDEISIVWL
jgi:predicted nucleic acid-binding protein